MDTRTVSRRLQNSVGNTDRHRTLSVDPQFHTAGGNRRIKYLHTERTTIGGGDGTTFSCSLTPIAQSRSTRVTASSTPNITRKQ